MTAIAAFSFRVPLVLGDLLITSGLPTARNVAVPALGDVSDFFGGEWSIAGLQQKVVLVTSDCAIAWAGSWVSARTAISELREYMPGRQMKALDVVSFFQQHPDVRAHGNAFVGWINEGETFRQFGFQAERTKTTEYGTLVAAGTGAFALREIALSKREAVSLAADLSPVNAAYVEALSFIGLLLRAEFHGGIAAPSIRNMFGGGYEVACLDGGRFVKASGVTFVVWEAKVERDEVLLSMPQLVVRQEYLGAHLLLRSVRLDFEQNGAGRVIDDQRHVIHPMFEQAAPSDLSHRMRTMGLNASVRVHCFLVHCASAVEAVTVIESDGPHVEVGISFKEADGRLDFEISQQFSGRVKDHLKEEFKSLAGRK